MGTPAPSVRRSGRIIAVSLLITTFFFIGSALAGPTFINYKANLTGPTGTPVADDNYHVTFKIWAEETGGVEPLWAEMQTVSTHNGSFHVKLGAVSPLDATIFEGELLWLGITVFPDGEMTPRTQIGSVPWAMNAALAERVKDKSVGAAQLIDKAVGQGQLGDKAVGQGQLGDKVVGQGQLGDKAVGKGQLEDKAVGKEQLEDAAVGNGQLEDLAVDQGKIADRAVGLGKLAQDGALPGQIIKWDGEGWGLDFDQVSAAGSEHWSLDGDNLVMMGLWSISKPGNTLLGDNMGTLVNLGVDSQVGMDGVPSAYATVGGGYQNQATSHAATVGGGQENVASGVYSTVPGGMSNVASGDVSFAAGNSAHAAHEGSVVLSATEGFPTAPIVSGQKGQMVLRANGHFYLTDSAGTAPVMPPNHFLGTSTGASLSLSGSWQSVSTRDAKENFTPLDRARLLEELAELEITRWNYKVDGENIQHIGPVAEDFHDAFGVGVDDKTISALDPAGIALAAIQELHLRVEELRAERQRSAELEREVQDLSRRVDELLRRFEERER